MEEHKCCGKLMYQEIETSGTLLSLCKSCGKTIKRKLKTTEATGKDGLTYVEVRH